MSLRVQFLLAWAIGIVAIVAANRVDDGFLALALITGPLLLSLGVRVLLDERVFPRSAALRTLAGSLLFMAGSGWTFGGIAGLLVLLGVTAAETGGS
jgi:hypothetical protein